MSISASIDVNKINGDWLFNGKTRKDGSFPQYLSITIRKNKHGRDQYGNDGFITQDVPKQFKAEGVRGPILGNWKSFEYTPDSHQQAKQNSYAPKDAPPEDGDIPF